MRLLKTRVASSRSRRSCSVSIQQRAPMSSPVKKEAALRRCCLPIRSGTGDSEGQPVFTVKEQLAAEAATGGAPVPSRSKVIPCRPTTSAWKFPAAFGGNVPTVGSQLLEGPPSVASRTNLPFSCATNPSDRWRVQNWSC